MSEINSEVGKEEDNACTLSPDEQLEPDRLDEDTLKTVSECCSESAKAVFEAFEPGELRNLGLVCDESIKCHLVYDQETLRADIANVVKNGLNTDIEVIVHGCKFHCHLVALHVATDYFKKFTTSDPIVINEEELSADGFAKAYKWIINPDAVPQRDGIIQLYLAARFLNMKELLKQLWYLFENVEFFQEGEAFSLYLDAIPYETSMLQDLLLTRISRFFLTAVATEEFLCLNPKRVADMLQSSVISVNSEMEVFMCAIRWLMVDWDTRKEYIGLLMKAVRFRLMPAWYILTLMSTKQLLPELKELLKHPFVQSAIDQGLSYSLEHHFVDAESPLQEPLHMHIPEEREWIIDEDAPHHHLYKCANWKYLDFDLFNIYLEQVIQGGSLFHQSLKSFNPSNLRACCQAVVLTN